MHLRAAAWTSDGNATFHFTLPPRSNVYVHSVAAADTRGQLSNFKAFLEEPERYRGCRADRGCADGGDTVLRWTSFERFLLLSLEV